MKLKLGTNDIFDCPEGKYRAILERVAEPKKRMNKPCAAQVRLFFRVKTSERKDYLVARTFCADLSYGSELYNFIDSWFDGDSEGVADENRELDLDLLIGKEADLLIGHYDNGSYDKPFVNITAIFPPGNLVQ